MRHKKPLYLLATTACFLDAALILPLLAFYYYYLMRLPQPYLSYWEIGISIFSLLLFVIPLIILKAFFNQELNFKKVNFLIASMVFWEILGTALSFFSTPGTIFNISIDDLQLFHLNVAGLLVFFLGNRISLLLNNSLFGLKKVFANLLMAEGLFYVLVPVLPVIFFAGVLAGMSSSIIMGMIFIRAIKQ